MKDRPRQDSACAQMAGSARGTGQRAKETLPVLWGWRKSEADLT